MNLKLDAVKLVNEDVISTSACKDVFGAIQIGPSGYQALPNGYRHGGQVTPYVGEDEEALSSDIANYNGQQGLYHFYINGNGKIVITEECPAGDNCLDENYHDIELGA